MAGRPYTGSRLGSKPNVGRLAALLSTHGIDLSTWVHMGRVDSDHDAWTWEPGTGWIVDVTLVGGKLDGVGPVPCRVAMGFASQGGMESKPLDSGCEVVVCMPGDGDVNDTPTIIGQINNQSDSRVPELIFGQPINEELARSAFLLVTQHSSYSQFGKEWRVDATELAGLHAGKKLTLGSAEADQAAIRGNELADALGAFLDGCGSFANLAGNAAAAGVLVSVGPFSGFAPAFVGLANGFAKWGGLVLSAPAPGVVPVPFALSAAGKLKAALVTGRVLSAKIFGE